VRVYLAGIHPGRFIWTYHEVAVAVGSQTFVQRNNYDSTLALIELDAQGRAKDWGGPVTVENNITTFALQVGVGEPVTATTTTSSGGGDVAGPYPTERMQKVWAAAKEFCP
jgi:hypothetical protein